MKISIIGTSYSGSTILARWLSQLDGFTAVGEVSDYLDGKKETKQNTGEYCSCGEKMVDCSFWRKVKSMEDMDDIIDSSKDDPTGDLVIYIEKGAWGLWKSAYKHRNGFPKPLAPLRAFRFLLKDRSYKRKMPCDIRITHNQFRKDPYSILREAAYRIGTTIGEESSHIALSNRSKYSELYIK